ncbi:MAG: hypothetical protein KKC76_20885 [Proteobacteria bacterium]|nr:hypothetical protein [Pseudomonadota bacterium]MBU4298404.1 hypothetical protein [Pseudomonadota bacterium]MCG2746232.1 hypothetical protein [Desulfobulbaceae bacterium]
MQADSMPQQHLVSLFAQQPCWMIEQLASRLGYSVPSVRRFLSETGYYSSFTHNGRWYTLRSIPQFDRDGLWFFDTIGYSRAGSLTNTLIDLTNRSPAGMTAEQLGEKLRCRCHSILVQLYRRGKLQRLKLGRSHVYLAMDPPTQAMQRQAMAGKSSPAVQLPAEVAVLILAEFIRHPDFSFEQLARVITHRCRIALDAMQIEELFTLHGIKKTMRITVPKS